jgi:hypothetical protein
MRALGRRPINSRPDNKPVGLWSAVDPRACLQSAKMCATNHGVLVGTVILILSHSCPPGSDGELAPNPVRKILLAVGLLAVAGFLAAVGFATYRLTHECYVTAGIGTMSSDSVRRNNELLSEVAAIGVRPSSDAGVLFEEFARRFSVIETSDGQAGPRDIQSIAKSGGGDRDELVFVLLTLFRWSGIDAEVVEIYSSSEAARERNRAKAIRQLVLAPALDQVFDPTLRPADQHKGSGEALLDGISRVHYDRTGFTTYQCPNVPVRTSLIP